MAVMEHMPPVGWADVATKHDLEATRQVLKKEVEALKHELRAEIHSVARSQLITFLSINAFIVGALNAGLFVALRLT